MKKALTFFSLISYTFLFSQITLSSDLPGNINSGKIIDVEVIINKGKIKNFGKYEMKVPEGYKVSAVEVKNGNFTFENRLAKIIWLSIPKKNEIVLKLKIEASSDTTISSGTFLQKFYYLDSNAKKQVISNPAVLSINNKTKNN